MPYHSFFFEYKRARSVTRCQGGTRRTHNHMQGKKDGPHVIWMACRACSRDISHKSLAAKGTQRNHCSKLGARFAHDFGPKRRVENAFCCFESISSLFSSFISAQQQWPRCSTALLTFVLGKMKLVKENRWCPRVE
jgi:hypothetical protein